MAMERVIVFALVANALISMSIAIPGQVSFYTPPYIPSSGYRNNNPLGILIAAVNPTIFNNRAACGRQYSIRCTGTTSDPDQPCHNGAITITIIDLFPDCRGDQFDISQEAFSMIADPNARRVLIDYIQ